MSLVIFTNIVFPALAGLFLLLCSVYFFSLRGDATQSSRYCACFLFSFALFLIGRPLQILSGEHPLPLIINALRMFLLCMVSMPMLLLTAELNRIGRYTPGIRSLMAGGFLLGLIYAVFRTLGTTGSYLMFQMGPVTAHASTMPSFDLPWLGREVSLAVQIVIGLILFAASLLKCLRLLRSSPGTPDWRQLLLYSGVMAFGASFAAGSVVKQWEVYYIGSFASSLIVGAAVILDVYRTSRAIEKSAPLLKGAILHQLACPGEAESGLIESLSLLGKSLAIDSFAVLGHERWQRLPESHAGLMRRVNAITAKAWRSEDYLLLPLGARTLGIAFRSAALSREASFELFEQIVGIDDAHLPGPLAVGISRPCEGLAQLHLAYREALLAHEMAVVQGKRMVIHIDSVKPAAGDASYPYRAQADLLGSVGLGDALSAQLHAGAYFEGLKSFVVADPGALKLRLNAAASLIFDAALGGGGDTARLEALNVSAYRSIITLGDMVSLHDWLRGLAHEAAGLVAEAQQKLSHGVFERAREYLDAHFQQPLTQEEVARALALSPSYFAHLFKKESGQTFSRYLTELRLNAARRLLLAATKALPRLPWKSVTTTRTTSARHSGTASASARANSGG